MSEYLMPAIWCVLPLNNMRPLKAPLPGLICADPGDIVRRPRLAHGIVGRDGISRFEPRSFHGSGREVFLVPGRGDDRAKYVAKIVENVLVKLLGKLTYPPELK